MTSQDWETNVRISNFQVAAIIFCAVVGFGLIVGPGWAIKHGHTGAPFMQLLVFLLVLGVVRAVVGLLRRHPGLELIGLLRTLLGPFGFVLGLAITLYWVALVAILVRQFGNIIQTYFIPATPFWAMLAPLFLVAIYLVDRGIETVARFFEVIILVEVISLFPVPFFLAPGVQLSYLLPVLPTDRLSAESFVFCGMSFAGYASLFVVAPAVRDLQRAGRAAGAGLALAGIIILTFTVLSLGTFGTDGIRQLVFPIIEMLQAARVPRLLSFLVRLAVLFLGIWTLAVVKTLTIALFAIQQNVCQLFGIGPRRRLWVVVGVSATIFAVALWPESTLMTMDLVGQLGVIEVVMVPCLTVLLWVVSLVRGTTGAGERFSKGAN